MNRLPLSLSVLLLLLAPGAVSAQTSFEGSYALQAPDGQSIVVRLSPASGGSYAGTLTKGPLEWRMSGEIDEDALVGTVTTDQGMLAFEAYTDGAQLELILAGIGADGMPDVDNAEQLVFARLDGTTTRQPAAAAQPDANDPLAGQWQQHLAGKKVTYISSYSSNTLGGGGMSTKNVYHLCSDGSFVFSDDSSISIQSEGSPDLGQPGVNTRGSGTWRILTQGQVAGIELRYHSGEASVYQLDYRDGATFADGTRVYVTPGEVCR